jgi:hypothetical protein
LARGAARQLYRLLRISAPLLRPIYQHIRLESRARAVTALVRIGWNGASVTPMLVKESEIVAPERLSPGVACIGHPAAESGVGEALRATARASNRRRALHAVWPRRVHHGLKQRAELRLHAPQIAFDRPGVFVIFDASTQQRVQIDHSHTPRGGAAICQHRRRARAGAAI